jgi:transposase InsO family protein
LIQEAIEAGARLSEAARIVGITARTYQRWLKQREPVDRRKGPQTAPSHQLTDEERTALLKLVNSPPYRNLSPEQVVAKAADKGIYIASERTIRRELTKAKQATYRERAKPATAVAKPRELIASKPLSVLTWDITYLPQENVRGQYFYLYLFIDIWSRRIVGAEVHEQQSSELSSQLLTSICATEGIEADTAALHADNGAAMRGSTMLATMQALGIVKSFSRPGVSDDNPFVESLFRHLKYAPSYPRRGFANLDQARKWVEQFVHWYNHQHLHSSIAFVTPQARHLGADIEQLAQRRQLYADARERNPRRWTREPRNWHRPQVVRLNPDRTLQVSSDPTSNAA